MKLPISPIALFMIVLPLIASGQRYHFEKITENEGLSDNRVTSFMKDRTGFMWIGTENGLNRYDGHEFRIYRPGQQQFNISHEHINHVSEDASGRLWVSTWSGLNVLDPKSDSLFVFEAASDAYAQKKKSISSSLIWCTYIDKKDRVWLAPDVRDLCYYDQRTDEFSYFPWMEFVKQNLPPQPNNPYLSIQKIERKNDNEIWLGTTRGLFSFNVATSTFAYYGGDEIQDCVSMHYDSARHRLFFAQENLYVYDEIARATKMITEPITSEIHSTILLPSLKGLWEIDPSGLKGERLTLQLKNQFTIHHQKVSTVFRDQGADWIGTYNGILLHSNNVNLFKFIPVFADSTEAAGGNVYHYSDIEKEQHYYLTSYTTNKLIMIDKKNGKRHEIKTIEGKPVRNPSRTYEDKHGRLWLLTARHIFYSDDRVNFKTFELPKDDGEYYFNDMIEDPDGNYWFSSLRYGVYFFNSNTRSWRLLEYKPDGLFATRPTRLVEDSSHNALWIGDFSFGLFRYDFTEHKFQYFGLDETDPQAMQSCLINDVCIDRNGDVWIASTSGGVSCYSQKDKNFKTYTMKTGLPENTVNAIQCDINGNIWLASHKGLTCIDPNGKVLQHYDQNNNLSYNDFTTPFSTNTKGEIFIGIAHGYLKFHPDSLVRRPPDFPVVITSSKISGTSLAEKSEFTYDQNEFTVQFAALTYSMAKYVKYYYQLEGYDDKWVEVTNKNEVTYTNLDNGSYSFKVKATDYSGKPSSNIASVNFTIDAPFWKRWWFVTIIGVLIVAGLYKWRQSLQQKIRSQEILNHVATSLYNQNTYEEVFWTIAKNCIDLLKFEDCVVYLLDDRGILVQKAAGGPKNKTPFQVTDPIEIPLGRGIVGNVAVTGKAEIISDTFKDRRYIIDDHARASEISVPIIIDGKVFGVIDSEHSKRNFYTRWHLKMLQEIASICSAKVSRYFVEEQIRSKVARDLHDDMGSSLSSINIMSKIALEKNEPIISNNYLKSIRENASLMQESLSDIIWAINPRNDTMENVVIRMKEFAAEILEPQNIQYEFVEEGELALTKMDINMRKDFYLIFKEAVNNAAKYSCCKKVFVHLSFRSGQLRLNIRDDGKGFNTSLNGTGNGLKNMKHRAKTIKAELRIFSSPGEGSTILLELPSHDQGIQ